MPKKASQLKKSDLKEPGGKPGEFKKGSKQMSTSVGSNKGPGRKKGGK